tara:strand:- start:301 stop:507 length:207 start_codon:yes stop_codon:yes gene_type:complete
MKVGDLIKYFNPSMGFSTGIIGLVVGYSHEAQGSPHIEGHGMVQVLFSGFNLLRWVYEQDCEVINEGR